MKRFFICLQIAILLYVSLICFLSCGDSVATETTSADINVENATNNATTISYEFQENSDGTTLLILKNDEWVTENEISEDVIPEIGFSSVEDMRDRLSQNKLTQRELCLISCAFPKRRDGSIPIVDLNNLKKPLLPTGAIASNFVLWYGERYEIAFDYDGGVGTFVYTTVADYQKRYQRDYEIFEEGEYKKEKEIVHADRNATEIVYDGGKCKTIRYTIIANGIEMQVDEQYVTYISNSVPRRVVLYCKTKESQCIYFFFKLTERPSVEFLSSFGIQDVPNLSTAS